MTICEIKGEKFKPGEDERCEDCKDREKCEGEFCLREMRREVEKPFFAFTTWLNIKERKWYRDAWMKAMDTIKKMTLEDKPEGKGK